MGTSKFLQFDMNDALNVVKNAVLVGVSAALVALSETVAKVDLGVYGPLIVPVVSAGLNTLIRWLSDYTKKDVK